MTALPEPRLGDRSLFPELQAQVYLNHAAMSPTSLPARRAAEAILDDYSRRGVGAWMEHTEMRGRLRERLARLLGCQAGDLALVPNTSMGVVDIALSLPWQSGDRLLCFEGEFPTNVTPWQRAAELFGLELHFHSVRDFELDETRALARLETELQRGLRLVAVSAVQFQSGWRMPLAEMAALCGRHGAELFVDAIQAVGAVPLDVTALGLDYLVAGGHKWLMGPEGTAVLYVRPERAAALRPAVASWLSHEQPVAFLSEGEGHLRYDRELRRSADVFEIGVGNNLGYAALEASVSLLEQLSVERIHTHVQQILDPLEAALLERGFESRRAASPERRSNILSLRPPAGCDGGAVWAGLHQRGIECGYPDGQIRMAPHWPNDNGQTDVVVTAVDEVLAELRA